MLRQQPQFKPDLFSIAEISIQTVKHIPFYENVACCRSSSWQFFVLQTFLYTVLADRFKDVSHMLICLLVGIFISALTSFRLQ